MEHGYATGQHPKQEIDRLIDARRVLEENLRRLPKELDAADKIEETLRALAPEADIDFQKLAVTPEQIEQWSLPSRPTKASDSRTRNWTGGDSVELDAIHPADLRDIVRTAIERHIEEEKLAKLRIAEESERELLKAWRPNRAARP